ncbi:MAG: 2-amino-4-hydroxy-6-hydroxymethyldihydropteridine diphosphokinase [Gloeobacteraceae cyanobacterium ES-bin-316]|nr:2-amino-4-hydroxy-6-hydroxymethyldihydropteridine diphosphokinase [Ferruginibacter sp.]
MNKLYLLLGGNLGDPMANLRTAQQYISKEIGIITRQSKLYQTAAWGDVNQPDFINQVIIVRSTLTAVQCLEKILAIEHQMGRIRTTKNAPRLIDIDILYFNKNIITTENLVVPHPAIQQRRFVLTPLNELSPLLIHPVLGKTNHELLLECKDRLNVKKI